MDAGGDTVMSIGEQLRQAREQHKVSLHAIAEKTNISVRFLDAIEKGQIDKLPGGIFTRGFVRSYAAQVGLDPDDTVKAFVAAHPEVRADNEVDDAQTSSGAGAVVRLAGLLALALAVLGGGAYWWLSRPAPVRPATPPALVAAPVATDVSAPPGPVSSAPPAVAPSDVASTDRPDAPAADPAATAVETPVASTMPLRLTVAPTGRCWVQVKADGRVRLAREVLAGERVDIEASERIEIVAGDAGAFGYQVNGTTGRPLGAAGRVGRATITADNLSEYGEFR
jgi:cytoskeleton protein RodZ